MTTATIAPIIVKNLLDGALLRGHSPEEILREQGLSPLLLTNSRLRISTVGFARLCQSIARLLGDEAYGLLKNPMPTGSFDLIFQACHSAETIVDSLAILKNALNLMKGGLTADMYLSGDSTCFVLNADEIDHLDHHYMIEQALSIFHRYLCWQASDFLPLKRVNLDYAEPSFADEYQFMFYGTPVYFDHASNELHFDSAHLERSCTRTRKELSRLLEDSFPFLISRPRQGQSTAVKVRLLLERIFQDGHGSPEMAEVAASLGTKEYTLRRQLKAEGYTFQLLREDTRRDMAIYHLDKKRDSIEEIAFMLAFSDSSAFIRAFRSWMGITPLAYRKLSDEVQS